MLFDTVRSSLARRLKSALLLIVAFAVALLALTQQRAVEMEAQGRLYAQAISQAEEADRLVTAIQNLRAQTLRVIDTSADAELVTARDQLTDTAITIANDLNRLRDMNGALYTLIQGSPEFATLDQQVSSILRFDPTAAESGVGRDRIIAFNERLTASAIGVSRAIAAQRKTALDRVNAARKNWHTSVTLSVLATIAIALGIFWDVTRNILPPLNRMHTALRRLADGELGVEIETFRLTELNALAAALETFRKFARDSRDLALRDPSTGLPNRRAFMEQGALMLAGANRKSDERIAIFLLDIDHFKFVNDDFGHATGDLLICAIGDRLQGFLPEGSIITRFGGDEFALLMALPDENAGSDWANAIVRTMRDPFAVAGSTLCVSGSLGYVVCGSAGCDDDLASLLNKADLALYAAKNEGRDRAHAFTTVLEIAREDDRRLERDLAGAMSGDALRMVYQPIISVRDNELEVEALVRWHHPELGEISPVRFIPAAERSGLMVTLGRWIIERALTDLRAWPQLTVSINLSPLQLQAEGFVAHLTECCKANGVPASRVMLEVTESISIERNNRALLALELLRTCGFRIALDDFGSGYSSLSMLKEFRFDRLKLDRSMVTGLQNDATARAVFEAAVTMARQLGAEVVAEGVSEPTLIQPVVDAGCTHVQGFHFSRPIEAEQVGPYYSDLLESCARAA